MNRLCYWSMLSVCPIDKHRSTHWWPCFRTQLWLWVRICVLSTTKHSEFLRRICTMHARRNPESTLSGLVGGEPKFNHNKICSWPAEIRADGRIRASMLATPCGHHAPRQVADKLWSENQRSAVVFVSCSDGSALVFGSY